MKFSLTTSLKQLILLLSVLLVMSCGDTPKPTTQPKEKTTEEVTIGQWTFDTDSVTTQNALIYNTKLKKFQFMTNLQGGVVKVDPVRLRKVGRKFVLKKASGFDSYTINPDGTLTWRTPDAPFVVGRGHMDLDVLLKYMEE